MAFFYQLDKFEVKIFFRSMDNKEKAEWGKWGEDLALNYLVANKYEIISRNYHSQHGEIDIIALKNKIVIFIEVKLRRSNLENAISSVTRAKQHKLVLTAQKFLSQNLQFSDNPTRFDIIAIIRHGSSFAMKHFPEAFLPRENW
jgi:putative endonuclease